MVGNRLDVVVEIRIEMLTTLALIPSALNDVPQVWNHARSNEGLSTVVEVNSPRFTGSACEDIKHVPRRVVTPDRSVNRNSLRVRCSRLPTLE